MPSLLHRLAAAEDSYGIQLTLLVLHAMLWHVITTTAAKRIAPWCLAQPWIKRFRARAGSTLRRGYGIQFDDENDMFALVMLVAAILCVHLTGGLLCVPALLAKSPTQLVVALAAHGSLVEAGWEFSDVVMRVTGVLGLRGPRGRAENPRGLVLLLMSHHAVAVMMVVPMNANALLRGDRDYHELSFLLQAAAWVAGTSQLYGFTLDCDTADGLQKMRLSVFFSWFSAVWSRGYRYAIVAWRLWSRVRATQSANIALGGAIGLAGMTLFNLAIIIDTTKKLAKFINVRSNKGAQDVFDGESSTSKKTL